MTNRKALAVAAVIAAILLTYRYLERTSYQGGPPENVVPAPSSSGPVPRAPASGRPPQKIAAPAARPAFLVADGRDVYWTTDDGAVGHVLADGGAPPALPDGGVQAERGSPIALDERALYFVAPHDDKQPAALMRLDRESGAVAKVAEEPGGSPPAMAADFTGVYWSTPSRGGARVEEAGGAVKRTAEDGGAPFVLAEGQATPCALGVDEWSVFWVSRATGSVWRVAKNGGGKLVSLAEGQSSAVCAIALDMANVYWIERVDTPGMEASKLKSVPKVGGEARIVAVETRPVSGLAVDDKHAYYLVPADGESAPEEAGLWRVSTHRGADTEFLARDPGAHGAVALDIAFVYWSGRGPAADGAIWRLPK